MPYRQNRAKENDLLEVQNGAPSTLFTGPGNRRLPFVCSLEATLQSIDASDAEEMKSEFLGFSRASIEGSKKSFDHWIERCQWAAPNAGNDHPS
jgi:hypothetical protein